MTSQFKTKPKKVKYLTSVTTVDELHKKYVNEYIENQKQLYCLKHELKKNQEDTKENNETLNNENINELKTKIKSLENNNSFSLYISRVYDIIINHYENISGSYYNTSNDIVDSTKTIDFNISENLYIMNKKSQLTRKIKKPVKKRTLNTSQQNKSILDYLIDENDKKQKKINEPSLVEKYLFLVDKTYAYNNIKICPIRFCSNCGIEKTLIQSEGCYVCQKCGETEHVIVESDSANHKESSNTYRKQNHLKERLSQFQAKDVIDIPNEIYENILKELKKKQIPLDKITPKIIRYILKQYHYTDYYEHLQQIYCKVSGSKPITLNRELEEKIYKLFNIVLELFKKYKPKERANFFNYSYLLNKLFRILGLETYATWFPLLRSPANLIKQDQIWEKICKAKKWTFHRSI